jgi:hypothetical protein
MKRMVPFLSACIFLGVAHAAAAEGGAVGARDSSAAFREIEDCSRLHSYMRWKACRDDMSGINHMFLPTSADSADFNLPFNSEQEESFRRTASMESRAASLRIIAAASMMSAVVMVAGVVVSVIFLAAN